MVLGHSVSDRRLFTDEDCVRGRRQAGVSLTNPGLPNAQSPSYCAMGTASGETPKEFKSPASEQLFRSIFENAPILLDNGGQHYERCYREEQE
jgi:hypothetical protein